jgi:phosphatidylglycerol:prolipoprotein diacylglycerol transferase
MEGVVITFYGLTHAAAILVGLALAVWACDRRDVPRRVSVPFLAAIIVAGSVATKIAEFLLQAGDVRLGRLAVMGGWSGAAFPAVVVAAGLVGRGLRLPVAALLDGVAAGASAGIVLGRLGCWDAGCCGGAAVQSEWLRESLPGVLCRSGAHPTQIYNAAFFVVGTAVVLTLVRRRARSGMAAAFFLAWFGLSRLVVSGVREGFGSPRAGLNVDQWVGAATLAVGVSIAAALSRRRTRGSRPSNLLMK